MNSPNQLSFLPDDYLERKARRRTNAICAVLFVVIMTAIGSAFTLTERSIRQVERERADVEQQFADAARRIEQVQKMQEKQRTMAHHAELTASLLEKVPRSFVLAEITNSMPAGVSLLDFSLNSKLRPPPAAPPKTAFEKKKEEMQAEKATEEAVRARPKVYDVLMTMAGVAGTDVQVAQFISKLNRSTLLRDVNLLISEEHTHNGEKLRRFEIEMTLNPDAEVQTGPEKKTKTAAVPLESQ